LIEVPVMLSVVRSVVGFCEIGSSANNADTTSSTSEPT